MTDLGVFYVWPDGDVQDTEEEGSEPYAWKSDDFEIVYAEDGTRIK